MSEVTKVLGAIEQGDPSAAAQLLPLVYDELRKLAVHMLAHEKAGQTLQATALVHEAYLRMVAADQDQRRDHRGHFFAAAAEAIRRILVQGESLLVLCASVASSRDHVGPLRRAERPTNSQIIFYSLERSEPDFRIGN